jgi:hypothetical protein
VPVSFQPHPLRDSEIEIVREHEERSDELESGEEIIDL